MHCTFVIEPMPFRWLRNRRRRTILATPAPGDWSAWIPEAIPWYPHWPPAMRDKLVADMKIFIAEKTWEGCNGLKIDDEMKCVIASQAAMMLTGITDYCFEGVRTLLVYPEGFRRRSGDGLLVWKEWRSGEAWHRGPVVLSWADIRQSWSRGQNLVVHELAHHLDGLDGYMDGLFSLGEPSLRDEWAQVSKKEIGQLRRQADYGMQGLLDPYGATSPAEFFAVVCEAFFEFPQDLRDEHPDLYRLISGFFNADPASWKLPEDFHPP